MQTNETGILEATRAWESIVRPLEGAAVFKAFKITKDGYIREWVWNVYGVEV